MARSVSAATRGPTSPPRRSARKSIPSMPQSVESTSITTEANSDICLTLEEITRREHAARVELALDRAHHPELQRRELQRQPTPLQLTDAMLGRDGAA